MTEPLWTADDVARFIGFSAKHVRVKLRFDPKFPAAIVISGKLRWEPAEIRAYKERQRESRRNHGMAA